MYSECGVDQQFDGLFSNIAASLAAPPSPYEFQEDLATLQQFMSTAHSQLPPTAVQFLGVDAVGGEQYLSAFEEHWRASFGREDTIQRRLPAFRQMQNCNNWPVAVGLDHSSSSNNSYMH